MDRPDEMPARLRLDLSYDGAGFSGWARQPGLRTVQATVEEAIARVLRLPDVGLTVAGRTDAGVHARGQVAHVDIPTASLVELPVDRLSRRLARILPDDLRVHRASLAPNGFDARFSALWRRYVYRIVDDPVASDPLRRHLTLTWPRRLDELAMDAAARRLVGEHDFAAFCRRREGATTVRTLLELSVRRDGVGLDAVVRADAFCHSMVRALVGALVAVGEGRRPVEWPAEVLVARTRDSGVRVLPAHGLTLEEVGYPADAAMAARAVETRAVRTLS
jgi:tRNA pseudouridine38-40 synthase